jgi:hypothetical protein
VRVRVRDDSIPATVCGGWALVRARVHGPNLPSGQAGSFPCLRAECRVGIFPPGKWHREEHPRCSGCCRPSLHAFRPRPPQILRKCDREERQTWRTLLHLDVLLRRNLHHPSRDTAIEPISTRASPNVRCTGDAACTNQSTTTGRGELNSFPRICERSARLEAFFVGNPWLPQEFVSPLVWDACVQLEAPGQCALRSWNSLHPVSVFGRFGRTLFPLPSKQGR